MDYRGKKDVRVFNECPFQVNLVGQRREYIFPPCTDDEPTMNFVDFDEIEYAHSRGKLFTIGLLTFDESDREGMYEALGVKDWQSKVWTNKDIEDIILHPTLEKMQRVIDIKDKITFERVRGMMVRFVNEKRDVSQNVINIINSRYKELSFGNMTTKIVIRPVDVQPTASSEEVDDLKRQLAEMQAMMAKMMDSNGAVASAEASKVETVSQKAQAAATAVSSTSEKKVGRRVSAKK